MKKIRNLGLITKTSVLYSSSTILRIVRSRRLKCVGLNTRRLRLTFKTAFGEHVTMLGGWNWLKIVPKAELWLFAMLNPSCYATLCSPLFELNRAGSPKTWGHAFQFSRVSSLPSCYSAVQTSSDTCTFFFCFCRLLFLLLFLLL
jgi:hypothetical protein